MEKIDRFILSIIMFFKKHLFKGITDTKAELFLQITKFCAVGVINTAVSYGVTVLCLLLGIPLLTSNAIAFIISTACAFFLNYLFVFKPKPCWYKGLIKSYLSYAFTGIGLNSVLLYVFSSILNISKFLSPLLTLVITIPCNFLLNKLWAFKK